MPTRGTRGETFAPRSARGLTTWATGRRAAMAIKDTIPDDVRERVAVKNPDWYAGRRSARTNRPSSEEPSEGARRRAKAEAEKRRERRVQGMSARVTAVVRAPLRTLAALFSRRRHV